jgi:hypothetical protein
MLQIVIINLSKEEFEDTKGVIWNRKSKKDGQYSGQKFEDTKGVFRIRNSKDRQHNGQKKRDKQRSTEHYI